MNDGVLAADEARLHWEQDGLPQTLPWRSAAGLPAPRRVQAADDTLGADAAYRLACEGTALLWRGDFQNARQLLQAMARRCERKAKTPATAYPEAFHRKRMAQAQRARILGSLLIPLADDYRIPLRRAPDVAAACREVYGDAAGPCVLSLRELQGLIGVHEWRKKGIFIAALDDRIHPHYGVFSPVRGEYLDLVAQAPLPSALEVGGTAFDIGTGTGVLAAVLARRGVPRVVATDQDARALACAHENIERLGLAARVRLLRTDLFPEERAALIVCNPPWVPGKPSSSLEAAVYDPDSRMLRGYLDGLAEHLEVGGEGWLILSDLAEHLCLRGRETLLGWIEAAGLEVLGRLDAKPTHGKASDPDDPLHAARAAELTSLWRLGVRR